MSAHGWRMPPLPADDHPTYLAHALALAARYGPGPWPSGGAPLPDAEFAARRGPLLMSGAVSDGIFTHHLSPAEAPDVGLLADLVQALVRHPPTREALRELHDAAAPASPVEMADALLAELHHRELPGERLREVGRWLAEHGTRRAAVAVGIILLGAAGDHRDRQLLLLLGALEDLCLYAVVALRRSQPDRDTAVFELARRVDGWGRIQAVERLAGTGDPEIKVWLLREGFRNRILDEYLAHLAATTGDLAGALAGDAVDEALLDGAGDILLALCRRGPARDMTDYPEAPQAIQRYLGQVGARPPTLRRIATVAALGRFIAATVADRLPWSPAHRAELGRRCAALTGRAVWRAPVEQALAGDDPDGFRAAIWPATLLGLRFADRLVHHLRDAPYDRYLWFTLLDEHDDIDGAVRLAGELLPLADLATGPSLDLGLADGGPDGVLDLVVSRLDEHPGKGWPLIRAALSNATVPNRDMAVRALAAWPPEAVPHEARETVRAALVVEPDGEVRAGLERLLQRPARR